MTPAERRIALALASVFGVRMLGMFLILPVFVLYAEDLPGATPVLMGLALGIYGLTQGLLQIPFGWISDRIGRKPVILGGLSLFALGSVIAALAPDMTWTLIGRAVQGAGAVAAVLTALLADLTREGVRTRAMALVGITIGGTFGLSLVFGPLLDAWVGVRGIFWLTAGLAVAGMGVVAWVVPTKARRGPQDRAPTSQDRAPTSQDRAPASQDRAPASDKWGRAAVQRAGRHWRSVLKGPLLRLDVGIFVLHASLTAAFVAVPFALAAQPRFEGVPHAWVYLPVLLLSVALMLPFVLAGDREHWRRPLRVAAVLVLAAALGLLALGHGALWTLALGLVLFFTAFNFLEAHLPAEVTKAAEGTDRGTALGFYSSCQFLGGFAGGLGGGLALATGGLGAVFALAALLALAWAAIAAVK